jgi:hypothetical protein
VYADLDNDGDLDLVINNINQPAFIYRNESQKLNNNHFLDVQLTGEGGNTQGLGATVKIFYKGQMQRLEQNPARGYLSSVSSTLHFGLGATEKIDSLVITWISGRVQKLYDAKANQLLKLAEKDAHDKVTPPKSSAPWFAETVSSIKYKETLDTSINDFNRQSLLISQLSYNGPCMAKGDINKDGLEDIIIGGTAGQATALYLQQKNGTFISKNIAAFDEDKACTDADIAVFDANADGHPDIYIASGGYNNFNDSDVLLEDRLYLNDGSNNFIKSKNLPAVNGSKSCVRIQDINGDGAPDIFVGGRVVPGRYPETPRSYILVNDGKGNFSDQTQQVCPELSKAGMVTDAAWVDLDLDQKNELVIVGEWMPVTVFKIENGRLINNTSKFFDKNYSGWWNKISIGDFNGDKRPDLIVGNMGLNTQFKASEKEPLEMYYKDFDNNGSVDPIFSFYIQGKRYPYVTRDELLGQLPGMRKLFADFKSYADITMDDLFDKDVLKDAGHLTANHMATSSFISNASGKLELKELPIQVQYSPAYTIDTMDFNGDGNTDLLLCGNNSFTKIRLGKFDANYGVLLEGDGQGNFNYIKQTESGFHIRGDVRSCVRVNEKIYFGICGQQLIAYSIKKQRK